MNLSVLKQGNCESIEVDICLFKPLDMSSEVESELDEMRSFVTEKSNQRWLWQAIERKSGKVLAYILGTGKDEVFLQLKALLEPFGITRFYTDDWGANWRHLEEELHKIGKQKTQKIENKHLTLRTRIKRLARKTICFSFGGCYARFGDWTVY